MAFKDIDMQAPVEPPFRHGKPSRPDNERSLLQVLLHNYGPVGAARLMVSDVLSDLTRRVDTARPTGLHQAFDRVPADANRYVPSTYALIDAVSARLAQELDLAGTGFVDVGSGKGKALIRAAEGDWASVRGIELSPVLHRIAVRNLARRGPGKGELPGRVGEPGEESGDERVRSELGDAAGLTLADHERVLYLFNPFSGKTLERCLDRIVMAGHRASRWLVYVNPTEHAAFSARFDLIEHTWVEPGHIEVAYFRTRSVTVPSESAPA